MTKPTIPCHPCNSCNGTGHRTLPAEYIPTFNTLRKLKSATCKRIHDTMMNSGDIKFSSRNSLFMVHKQVARMEAWGVIKRSKQIKPERGDLRTVAWEFRVA